MNTKTLLRAGIGVSAAVILGVGAPLAFADGMDTTPTPTPSGTPVTSVPTPVTTPTVTLPSTTLTKPTTTPECTPTTGTKSAARGDGKVLPLGAMRNTEVAAKRTAKFTEWVKQHPELAKKLAEQRARVHAKHAQMGNGMYKAGKQGTCAPAKPGIKGKSDGVVKAKGAVKGTDKAKADKCGCAGSKSTGVKSMLGHLLHGKSMLAPGQRGERGKSGQADGTGTVVVPTPAPSGSSLRM